MSGLLLSLSYLGTALLLTTLLYYPVFQVVSTFGEVRPDRVFYRLAMLVAVVGFWPYLKLVGINSREALGFSLERRRFKRTLVIGLVIGVLIMTVHMVVLVLLGVRIPIPGVISFGELLHTLLLGLLTGLAVALIEETYFRGALHYHLRRSSSLLTTAITTSLLYAAVHFIRPPDIGANDIGWHSGWEMLTGMFHKYQDFAGFADNFIALTTAGLLLSLVRERTGNIALCIGIHAGWVMIVKLVGSITYAEPNSPAAILVSSYNQITGWAATALLGLLTFWYWRYAPAKSSILSYWRD